jgi:hypothetical protein
MTSRGDENLIGQELLGEKTNKLKSYARGHDYHYSRIYEAIVRRVREANLERIDTLGKKYREFLEQVRKDPLLKDSTIILTADHGSIYGKGKYFYAYHPNQEVVQVLCAVTGPHVEPKLDDRLFSTPDLTASVLDYFGLISAVKGQLHSIFAAGSAREYTATLTLKSDKWKEWWLVLAKSDRKQWINIHPEGTGEVVSYPMATYDESPPKADTRPSSSNGPVENAEVIGATLREFGVAPEAIHPSLTARQ